MSGLVFGESRVCRQCHGSKRFGGFDCVLCGGSGIQGPEKVERIPGEGPIEREGKVLRDRGMEKVERAEDPVWIMAANRWVQDLPSGREFTAEDLCEAVGRPRRPNAVGARLSGISRRGIITPVGYAQAERSERHSSRMLRWRRR